MATRAIVEATYIKGRYAAFLLLDCFFVAFVYQKIAFVTLFNFGEEYFRVRRILVKQDGRVFRNYARLVIDHRCHGLAVRCYRNLHGLYG